MTAAGGIDFDRVDGADGRRFLPETMGGGVGIADVDADGDLDLLTGADSGAAIVQWNEAIAALEMSDSVITG
ncbi:MAG: hypothetical protein ACKOJI_06385, partial [Phycisphaerales bacterium]